MKCSQCGNNISPTDEFCQNCGARAEDVKKTSYNSRRKPRKDYSEMLYMLLSIVPMSACLGLNDLYAGFYKLGGAKLLTSVIGLIVLLASQDKPINDMVPVLILLGAVIVFGFIEAALAFNTLMIKVPGTVYWTNRLDMLLDSKGVAEAVYRETGYEVNLKMTDGERP